MTQMPRLEFEMQMAENEAVAQMRALLAEREALDEWAWRLSAAKREAALRFDAETRALLLEKEALDARAEDLFERESIIADSQALRTLLLHPHVDDQNVGGRTQKVKKRKSSDLEPASGKKKPKSKMVLDDQPDVNQRKLPQGEEETPCSEVSEWWCALCKVDCPGADGLASHLSGKKHTKMLEDSKSKWWCAVCKINCENDNTIASHLAGKKHRKMSEMSSEKAVSKGRNRLEMDSLVPLSGMRERSEEETKASGMQVSESWCVMCQLECHHAKNLASHQAGRKHRRKALMESMKEAERLHSEQEINVSPLKEGAGCNDLKRENDGESSNCE